MIDLSGFASNGAYVDSHPATWMDQ